MTGVVLVADIGGTKTAVALADAQARILHVDRGATPAKAGPAAVIGTVAALAERVLARMPDAVLRGVGIATAGVVDVSTGSIVSATDTFADWPGTPVAALVRASLGERLPADAPVHVQNDVDAHAMGEFHSGAGAGARSMLDVAVGTGVGAGVILDGQVMRGARHVGGELGHVPTPGAQHLLCPCGRYGHLEAIGSGIGLHAHYRSLGGDPTVLDARGIAERCAAGDALARRAIEESATAVGRAIAGAATLLDPERVVVTGGVVQIGEVWWNAMTAAVRADVIDALHDLPILPGALGDDAPLRGAAASVLPLIQERS